MTLTTDVDTFLRLCPTALPANSGFLVTKKRRGGQLFFLLKWGHAGHGNWYLRANLYQFLLCRLASCCGNSSLFILFFPLENSEMQQFGLPGRGFIMRKMNKAPPNFEEYRGQGKNILGDAMNHRCLCFGDVEGL